MKAIVYKCVICCKIRKHHFSQIMSDIPDFIVKPNPPFTYSAVDFFGPIMVRGEVNERTWRKVWGCVYTCLSSRAVYVDMARDHGTDSLLLVHRNFSVNKGMPQGHVQ